MREAPLSSVLLSADASSGVVAMVKTANANYPDMSVKHGAQAGGWHLLTASLPSD